MTRVVALSLVACALAACAQTPATQTMVRIEADPEVVPLLESVRVVVRGGAASQAASAWTERHNRQYFLAPGGQFALPIEVALQPEGGDATRRFEVVATPNGLRPALRAQGGYVQGTTRLLVLRFLATCPSLCLAADQTCLDGTCTAAPSIDPATLPLYTPARDAGSTLDGAPPDLGSGETGPRDVGPLEAGPLEAGPADLGPGDTGPSDLGPPDLGPRDAGPLDLGLCSIDCNDNNPCTTDACVASACMHVNNTAPCDDGMACTTGDACNNGMCRGAARTCPATQVCNPANGTCGCPPGQMNCGGTCRSGMCCPGQTGGSCPRCGTNVCNGSGNGYDCTNQTGNCDFPSGRFCMGDTCSPPCPPGQGRGCGGDCNTSGCY